MDKTFLFSLIAFIAVCSPEPGATEPPMCPGQCRMPNNSCIDVGKTVKDGCITYKCSKNDQTYIYQPSEIGCDTGDGCLLLDTKKKDPSRCIIRKCRRNPQNSTVIQLKDRPYGCRIGGGCLRLNKKMNDTASCTIKRCKRNPKDKSSVEIKERPYGCSFRGSCMPFHSKIDEKESCTIWRCKQKHRRLTMSRGCKVDGGCLPLGRKMNDTTRCSMRICIRDRKNSTVIEVINKPYGCEVNGACVPFGKKVNDTARCSVWRCRKNPKDKSQIEIKERQYGCMGSDGVCHALSRGDVNKEDMWPGTIRGKPYGHCFCQRMKENGKFVVREFCQT